jgi:response regulator NasT
LAFAVVRGIIGGGEETPAQPNMGEGMTLRVLLVDDNAERAAAVTAGLEADGCVVVALLPDHADMVAEVRRARADVIVCDLDHASRDAIDSMRALHRDEPRPVVMFVDRTEPGSIAAAMEAGVAAYVVEGLSPSRVRAVIDVAVARFQAHQALRAELAEVRSQLSERKLVERAKGLLMQTRRMSEEEAYRTLRRLAMDQGKRLADVAESVISMAKLL